MPDLDWSASPNAASADIVLCKRMAPRHQCPGDLLVRFVVSPGFTNFRAYVRDISLGGIGLFLDRPLAQGAIVAIQISDDADLPALVFRAKVAQVTPLDGEGWIIGCAFVNRLREAEMALIRAWFF